MAREGFAFANAEEAMQFYELCIAIGATTYEERLAVLREMVKQKKTKYVRDAEEFYKGKKVLKLRPKKEKPSA